MYFMSTSEARDQFAKNPYRYLHLPANCIPVPIRLAIVGPPKSGKSTGKQYYCFKSTHNNLWCIYFKWQKDLWRHLVV